MEITVVLVSWNDAQDLEEAVRSLAQARSRIPPGGPGVSLVVVGNGPASVKPEAVLAAWPGASILVNAENRGFGPAVNQAAAVARGEVLLLVNPDTRPEGEPFSALARGFQEHPEAVALAPRVVETDGQTVPSSPGRPLALRPVVREDQFTFQLRRLPTLAGDLRELSLWDHFHHNGPARRRERYADVDRDTVFPVEQPAASALALRSEGFRRVSGFDEAFAPAWFEDVDLCKRLAPLGTILHFPAARFRHSGGASARRLGYDRFLPVYYKNALLYRRKHYTLPARAAYRLLLVGGMLLRLAANPFRKHPPRPPGQSRRAYCGVLAVALGFRA